MCLGSFDDFFFPLRNAITINLLVVELGKVVDDDGNGEGHDEDAADGAGRAHDLAWKER